VESTSPIIPGVAGAVAIPSLSALSAEHLVISIVPSDLNSELGRSQKPKNRKKSMELFANGQNHVQKIIKPLN